MASANGERRGPSSGRAWLGVWAVALACAALAYGVRVTSAVGFSFEGAAAQTDGASWGSYDPDSLYHARRVARAVRNHGWVQSTDPLLAHPEASVPIPWPPFYDLALTALYRRAIPSPDALMEPEAHPELPPLAQGERDRIERFVATVPSILGALTALFAALIAAGRARRVSGQLALDSGTEPTFAGMSTASLVAAAIAGVSVALTFGHIRYSHLGNGDHHAFVSFLHLALLGVVVRGLDHERIVQPFWSAVRGAVAGFIAAALITSWTASILWVALVQLALVVRLLVPFRSKDGRRFSARGLPIFATSFHKAALLGVVPAVIESPFSDLTPWSLVDLSWFHLAWLSIGWLVFAPYALMPSTAAKSRVVALAPAAVVALLLALATPAAASMGSALSWASAGNTFMSSINESRPLLGAGAPGWMPLLKFCGMGVLLAPLIGLVWLGWVRRQPSLLPLVVLLPWVVVAALLQRRFSESLAAPLAVSLGLFGGVAYARLWRGKESPGAGLRLLFVIVAAAAAAGLHPWTIHNTSSFRERERVTGQTFPNASPVSRREAALAKFLRGMRGDLVEGEPAPAVLAHWDLGHAIEWRAGWATVATNFGLYVGEDAFLDPWRFFTEVDPERAEELMIQREVDYVLIDGDRNRAAMEKALGRDLGPEAWPQTMAARLLRDGVGGKPLPAPGFLSLVRLAKHGNGGTIELYRRVPGAVLEVASARTLQVTVQLAGEDGARVRWQASAARPGSDPGPLSLRVPYADTGQGTVKSIQVFVDSRPVDVGIELPDVLGGRTVTVGR